MRQPLPLRILRGIWVSIVLMGLASGLVSPPPVAATTLLDSADYTFVYPNLPDPAVWSMSAQGNVMQQPVEGLGLGMSDPDNSAMLMYVHPTPFLSGDPNDPNFHNTATFRVRAQVPYVSDASSAWSADAIGWRMIIDDGSHRLELALARSPAFARQVWIQNCATFAPMPFSWDNEGMNTYEISRLANGDFVITLINADPSQPAISQTVSAGQLSPSGGTPMFAWGSAPPGGGAYYWLEAHAEVSGPATTTLLDSAGYSFVYPNLPDPAVWSVSAQGNVVQLPVEGLGLVMSDPDNASTLMYVHPTPFLSGDPNDPNFHNTATFRVRAQVPYVSDASSAWSADAIGWRMVLDDGSRRLELALSRSTTSARQVRIQNCSFDPVYFPWDNGFANTYEITRLANGDFVLTLVNGDPANPNPVITRTIPATYLPGSGGEPLFAWGMGWEGGGAAYWLEAKAQVFGPAAANQPPETGTIAAPLDPVPVNTTISASAPFSDPDPSDTHTALWDWGDGSTSAGTVSEANGAGTASGDHAYSAAGVYPLTLTVTDDHSAEATATFQYVVVYDPSAGFVTGGGWINSPAGAYAPDPSLTGKANFGFVSRYKKGANTPTGQTEFQFKAGDLNFRSTAYDWLVIAGARAQFKGLGAINGAGEYGFLLTVTDGQVNGGGGADKLRIKIWDRVTDQIIYDNQMGAADAADPATAIGGGSIVIHK